MGYTGKQFEEDFKASVELYKLNLNTLRLYDTMGGYKGIKNPCDFIVFHYGHMILLELKTTKGKSLPLSNITEYQWEELHTRSFVKGIECGFFVHFQDLKECYYVPISVAREISHTGKRSISIKDCKERCIQVPLLYKRTRFTINLPVFLNKLMLYV